MAEEATWSMAVAAASSAVDSDSEDAAVAAAWDDGKGPAVVPVFRTYKGRGGSRTLRASA